MAEWPENHNQPRAGGRSEGRAQFDLPIALGLLKLEGINGLPDLE